MSVVVAISKVSDGSMYNRNDHDDPAIFKNRAAFLGTLGITVDQTTRVKTVYEGDDYTRYSEVDDAEKGAGMTDDNIVTADALVTRQTNHALMLPVADCVGATIYDPRQRVLMVSHLGRHSLERQGGKKSVEFLVSKYGSNPADLQVWLTPAPGKDIYPIWALDNKGMKEVTFEQLQAAGIKLENIIDNPAESDKDLDYYSYSEFLKGNRDEDGDIAIVAMMTD